MCYHKVFIAELEIPVEFRGWKWRFIFSPFQLLRKSSGCDSKSLVILQRLCQAEQQTYWDLTVCKGSTSNLSCVIFKLLVLQLWTNHPGFKLSRKFIPRKKKIEGIGICLKLNLVQSESSFWTISSYSTLAVSASSHGHTKCKADGDIVVYSVSSKFKFCKNLDTKMEEKIGETTRNRVILFHWIIKVIQSY